MLTCIGHWIQACPTNDDAAYDGKQRIRKTTGIPRSMLQKVDKSEIENLDEDIRQNVMITSEGEYVLAQADKKTWQKFQDQKNATDKAQKDVQTGDRELQELGLECPIDKRMFVDPMKTPCCGKTYCHECIENALLDNDLQCPNCQTENVSLERLEPDEAVKNKIEEYTNKKESGGSNASSPKAEENASRPGSRDGSLKSPKSPSSVAGKKRSASEAAESKDSLAIPAPAMKRQKSGGSDADTPKPTIETTSSTLNPANSNNVNGMPAEMQAMMQQMQNMPNMNGMNIGFPGMMPPFVPNMNPMMNPMMMMGMNGMGAMPNMNGMPNFNNMNSLPNMNGMDMNGGYQNFNQNTNGNHAQGWNNNNNNNHHQYGNNRGGFRGGKKFNNFNKTNSPAPQQPPAGLENAPKGPKSMLSGPPAGVPTGPAAGNKFSNQQRPQGNEEDNAYMRQPVNPQRAMNRDRGRRGMRNAEYKEL